MLVVMYQERRACLPGAVVWTRTARDGGPVRIVPDGGMDVIWMGGDLIVAGPDTGPHLTTDAPGDRCAGIRFAPGAGPRVLGVPAAALRDGRVPLAALWPSAEVRRMAERLDGAADPAAALEALVIRRSPDPLADPWATAVAHALGAGRPVAAVSGAAGLSERQMHRRSLAAFGYGPKTLARVLRLNRALALARRGTPQASVAAVAGYADQAHLAREVKALTGVPLSALS
jgi:AraC-like DNA-binding protein